MHSTFQRVYRPSKPTNNGSPQTATTTTRPYLEVAGQQAVDEVGAMRAQLGWDAHGTLQSE